MNTKNNTYCGHISRFYKEKHFGFIETEDNNSYFFFVVIVEQNRLRKAGLLDRHQYVKYNSGDEVEFKLKPSEKDNSKVEAYDIKFIRNLRIQKLVDEAIEKDILLGYLKQVDNNTLYVKHVNTYVFIPVDISEWEINYDSVYTNRLNKLVEFKLLQRVKLDKLKAVLTVRIFCDEYYQLVELKES